MSDQFLQKLFGMDEQVVVVIGGTGVLGGALSMGIAGAGALVVVAGRDPEKGKYRVDKITAAGGKASFYKVDVSSRDSLLDLLSHTIQSHGRVDGLVNCAGVNSASAYLDVEDEDWDRVLDINLTALRICLARFSVGKWCVRAKAAPS